MNGVGLSMVIDPRWVAAVPDSDGVAAAVARQMGGSPEGASADEWRSVVEGVTSLAEASIAEGAAWCGIWLGSDATGEVVLTRAELRQLDLPGAPTAGEVLEELVVVHRDDEYEAELGIVDTLLGPAVRVRQGVATAEGAVQDSAQYIWPNAGEPLVLEAYCTRAGWQGVWGPQLEAMAVTARRDSSGAPGTLTMRVYDVGDEVAAR